MRIPNRSSVLVTDGRKSLFFRNEGDAEFPNLRLVSMREQANPADREQKSDAPGHVFSSGSGGARRSAYGEVDFHQRAEDGFAGEVADFLRDQALAGALDELIVVAPPRTLGELRKHYHGEVRRRIAVEIPKDLVKHPVAEIERIIARS